MLYLERGARARPTASTDVRGKVILDDLSENGIIGFAKDLVPLSGLEGHLYSCALSPHAAYEGTEKYC